MKKSNFLIGIAAIPLLIQSCGLEKQAENIQPNIVFILADDLGWADLPVYGNKFNEAPNIETLAKEGMMFKNAYAACPVCSPTRASILSGQYPAHVGVIDFLPGHWRPYEEVTVPRNRTQYLPLEIKTIGETMKEAGYSTGYFGKWHLGFHDDYHPSKQGFDEAVVYDGGGFYNFGNKMRPPLDIPSDEILSETLTNLSVDFIENKKEKPFFLFLAHYDVHVQLDADSLLIQKYLKKNKNDDYPCNAIYAAMIDQLDQSVGRVMQKLEDLGIAENTMIVFFSDNGGLVSRFDKIPLVTKEKSYIYENDTLLYVASSNKPLRAEKGTVFEGGIRVPLIVKWPGKIEANSVSEALVSSIDFYPTFTEIAMGVLPEEQALDGKSIVPELTMDNYDEERAIFWHYPVYHHDVPASAVRKGDWKLIHFLNDGRKELYNLKEDIGETSDKSADNPEKTVELYNLLDQWRVEVKAEMPVPNPDFNEKRREEWLSHPDREILFNGAQK